MIFNKKILIFLLFFFLNSCAEYQFKSKTNNEKKYYSSNGFALIYEENLFLNKTINKRIQSDGMIALHSSLKRNTYIKVINPVNMKEIELKISKTAIFPKIFNLAISRKVAEMLILDVDNPYIQIYEVKKNKTFIAKESNTFNEEKNVAEKAPVETIEINDLSKNLIKNKKKTTKKSNFYLIVSDFYYKNSADRLKINLTKQTKISNFDVEKISDNKFRLGLGPFRNFNALKSAYISLNNLGFEDLKIYRK